MFPFPYYSLQFQDEFPFSAHYSNSFVQPRWLFLGEARYANAAPLSPGHVLLYSPGPKVLVRWLFGKWRKNSSQSAGAIEAIKKGSLITAWSEGVAREWLEMH